MHKLQHWRSCPKKQAKREVQEQAEARERETQEAQGLKEVLVVVTTRLPA
jgi:hypothetical protein